jgi:hypothetical protein
VSASAVPPGWPRAVRPPDVPGWEASATGWLLDQCPPEYRGHEVLRRHPSVLARFAAHHVAAALEGARAAYAGARRELGERVDPEVLDASLRVLEAEGARLSRTARQVALVEEALLGTRWRSRL